MLRDSKKVQCISTISECPGERNSQHPHPLYANPRIFISFYLRIFHRYLAEIIDLRMRARGGILTTTEILNHLMADNARQSINKRSRNLCNVIERD